MNNDGRQQHTGFSKGSFPVAALRGVPDSKRRNGCDAARSAMAMATPSSGLTGTRFDSVRRCAVDGDTVRVLTRHNLDAWLMDRDPRITPIRSVVG